MVYWPRSKESEQCRACLHFAVHAVKKYCRPFNDFFWLLMQSVYPLYVNKGQKLLESEKKKKLV